MGPTERNRSEGARERMGNLQVMVEETGDKQLSSQHYHQDSGHSSTPLPLWGGPIRHP